jgi:hypothetical protein
MRSRCGVRVGRGCFGGVVEMDPIRVSAGEVFGAVADGVDGGAAHQVRQVADHAGGASVQILVERRERKADGGGGVPPAVSAAAAAAFETVVRVRS